MWYAVHSKPREELTALSNLSKQGFECFLPMITIEKVVRGKVKNVSEPMFSRYLFVKSESQNQNFSLIRSSRGVLRLLSFGSLPCEVNDSVIQDLKFLENKLSSEIKSLFKNGDPVLMTDGPLKGLYAIFKESNGIQRAFVLIELLGKTHKVVVNKKHLVSGNRPL